MCGITGIINTSLIPVSSEEISTCNNLITHRGPDDEGYFFGNNFAFGHRRLSIIDLTNDGHQPMEYQDRYVITYNGEVYNYREIKEELQMNGYLFYSRTDTEVILASYDKWGEECVHHFNGMWAFAIYDKVKNTIFCSRDRFGIKPFYYMEVEGKFIFGSEIKQLLLFSSKKANFSILLDFLVTGIHEHTHETFFQNIYKLQPSHNLIYDLTTHKYHIQRYYTIGLNKLIESECFDAVVSQYEDALKRAIRYRLHSDVKVGACLSGGLDSSTIATLASLEYHNKSQTQFTAIHAKSIEKETDESEYAKIVASNANLDLHITEPSIDDFKAYLDDVIYTQEEPFGGLSIFMQYFVMLKAKELGCKVMLDGQGGDETLLGYEKYYPAIYWQLLKQEGFISSLKEIFLSHKNNPKMTFKTMAYYIIGSFLTPLRQYIYWQRAGFVHSSFKKNFLFLKQFSKSYHDIFMLQKYEIEHTNLPMLLRYEDKNSMCHSVETRLPFIDYKTLEIALSMNAHYKIAYGWTKYILRVIGSHFLPQKIAWRKNKLGFNAPDTKWMAYITSSLKQEVSNSDILMHLCDKEQLLAKIDTLDNAIKWRLYNIAVWERLYNVKKS